MTLEELERGVARALDQGASLGDVVQAVARGARVTVAPTGEGLEVVCRGRGQVLVVAPSRSIRPTDPVRLSTERSTS